MYSFDSTECPYGLYGDECIQVCECSDMGVCSQYNGSCDCSPGWTGTICDTGIFD